MKFYTFEEWKKHNFELLEKEGLNSEEICEECNDRCEIKCEKCNGDGECDSCGTECNECDGSGNIECEECECIGKLDEIKINYDQQLITDKRKLENWTKIYQTL